MLLSYYNDKFVNNNYVNDYNIIYLILRNATSQY